MIAGASSGSGKTTITCALLGALKDRRVPLRSYKCGPDYIDPMFHSKILGISSRNLDSFLCSANTVKYLFDRNTPSHTVAVIEGVMGYYDGVAGTGTQASSHDIARILDTPVVLVVDCRGKSLSLAAELQGFLGFQQNRIAGVILNNVGEHAFPMYKRIVEEHTALQVVGYMPHIPEAEIESRHLGLVTAGEISDLRHKLGLLAEQAAKSIDLDLLLRLAATAGEVRYEAIEVSRMPYTMRIGMASDHAFCFYYHDNLDLLKMLGARLVPFSPVTDDALPPGICGLLLGGGYPELNARLLSNNKAMLSDIRAKVLGGLPTLAECGGFMVLGRALVTADGERHEMAGVLNTETHMTKKLSRFGYVTLTARRDNLLCRAGEQINAHEFHYSQADDPGDSFIAQRPNGRSWDCNHTTETLFAGYSHLHLWSNRAFAQRFLDTCADYRRRMHPADMKQ